MCGIFGIFFFEPSHHINKQMVRDATDVMLHRGPDDAGYFVDDNIGLGHRRLSIIDLSSGHQPMTNEDGSIIVVYNGEIYNYSEIKKELTKKGHTFRTNSDTEVIVHAYEEWGEDSLQRFNGMFAFILLDKRHNLLWIVRDRLGIKPLYYYRDNEVFIAASEIKALLKTGLVKAAVNENVLDAYFSVGYVPGPETMFKGIKKLLPGHYLVIQDGRIRDVEYWDFANIDQADTNEAQTIEKIHMLIQDCVKKRLISDVPVGAFLSGGLDSSIVVALMAELINPQPVNTFTVAYHDGFSEHEYAQLIADTFRTSHHVFYLESDDFLSSLKTLIQYAEEPIVDPAAISLYHISRLAREHAIVLLSGEGSDEIFAGYYLYKFMAKLGSVRQYIPNFATAMLPRISRFLPKLKHKKYLDWASMPLNVAYRGTSGYLTPSVKKFLYHPDFLHSKSSYLEDRFKTYFNKVKHRDPLSQMLYVDTKTWLVDDLLVKADKMTMAASIELRVPFLDFRLVEAAYALSPSLKIRNGNGKYLLKKISESTLPKEIIHREKKGFPVPTKEWFKGDLLKDVSDVLSAFKQEPWIDKMALDKLISSHGADIEDNSKILMTMMSLQIWKEIYL